MLFKKYVNATSNVFASFNLAKFIIIILVVMNFMQYYTNQRLHRLKRETLVPMGLHTKVEIGDKYLDANYLKAMGVYINDLLYDFTPETVVNQYSGMSKLFDPQVFASYEKSLLRLAEKYRTTDVSMSSRFLGMKIIDNKDGTSTLKIKSEIAKYIMNEPQQTKVNRLQIKYKIDYGMFRVLDLREETDA